MAAADVEVIIPWGGGCEHRGRALDWLLPRWAALGWTVTVADAPPGPWVKADAVNPAVEASSAAIVVVADADVWCDGTVDAVAEVQAGATWAIPHGRVRRLSPSATGEAFDGRALCTFGEADLIDVVREGMRGGGLVVLPRALALEAPMDHRFVGWGGEDYSWGLALLALAGRPWRGALPLWHLWHPPQERMDRAYGSHQERDLRLVYRAALRQRDKQAAMRAVLAHARRPESQARLVRSEGHAFHGNPDRT